MPKKVRRNPVKKVFLNFEKEEKWLNKMCEEGHALEQISNGYYFFKSCEPGKFIYRINFSSQEMSDLAEQDIPINSTHVEQIATINRWQYFRRPKHFGNFELYSDDKSKIKHYQRMNIIWYMLALPFIVSSFMTGFELIFNKGTDTGKANILFNLIILLIGLFFLAQALPLSKKIKNLKDN